MTRQKTLKEQYFFTCKCPRCIKVVLQLSFLFISFILFYFFTYRGLQQFFSVDICISWFSFLLANKVDWTLKGQHEDIQESATLEGYKCKNNGCDGFLLRDTGTWKEQNVITKGKSWYSEWLGFISDVADDKGFICQLCGHFRSKEEIKKVASEIKSLSDKALMFETSHRILLYCFCENCKSSLAIYIYIFLLVAICFSVVLFPKLNGDVLNDLFNVTLAMKKQNYQ